MYNGHYSIQEIKDNVLFAPKFLKEIIGDTPTNREDIKNKIVILTQCLISESSYNSTSQQICDVINAESEKFLDLI